MGELQKAGKSSTSTRQPRTLQQQRRLLYDLLREHDSAAYSPRLCQVGKSSGRRSIWPTRKTEENVNQIEGKRPGKELQRTKPGRHCKGQNRKPKRRTRPGNELRQQKKKEKQETEKLQQSRKKQYGGKLRTGGETTAGIKRRLRTWRRMRTARPSVDFRSKRNGSRAAYSLPGLAELRKWPVKTALGRRRRPRSHKQSRAPPYRLCHRPFVH